ncbi:hypothetical protein BLA29_008891 [Euroglyphus maynei]|uniref:EGF-like domain-containing protein n=1 Tax=Euroglyphus maynei TaxID=6958 RepID=A0A1Y3BIS6_EURMA|nr:hypothetical protein BLA29_008891 [Euroglyphus maynei]
MSDCLDGHESNGYFSCECNKDYFVVEKSYQLKTNDPSIINKNEHCLGRQLCGNCTDDNQQCFEMDPVRSKDDKSKWRKERLCGCQPGYRRDSEQEPCVNVCQPDTCASGGDCLPVGNDGYKCQCDSEHYGERCENEFASNVGWIVAIVILSLVTVGAIAGLAYVLLFKNK